MWLIALRSSLKQNFTMMRRYLFNALSGFATLYMVFALLFMGAKSISGGAIFLGNTLEGLFAGYVTWMLAILGCTDLAWNVTNEAQTGTFEQQYLSPVGYKWIAVYNGLFNFLSNSLMVMVITLSMSLTTGQKVHLDMWSILPIMLSVYLQATGMGFALAGLALIYKRVQAFFQIVQFAIIGLFMIPWDRFPWAKFLPLAMGQRVLQRVLMNGDKLWEVPPSELLVMAIVTFVYLFLGTACFSLAESKAREKGLLGQY